MRNPTAGIFSGAGMMLLQPSSRFILKILESRAFSGPEKSVDLDCHSVEFNDIRYHVQFSVKSPNFMLMSVSLPIPPPETVFVAGLPFGAIEAVKAAYGTVVQILDPPKDGYNLTMKLNLSKLPSDEEQRHALLSKIASVREVVLGAPLRVILKHLASRTVAPNVDKLVALVHRPEESFFVVPQAEKVIVVFPMRFKDSVDTTLATSFLQEFVEARRTTGLNNAPPCTWSPSAPLELKGAPAQALAANAGFVTFVIFPRHVEGGKLDRTAWSLSTFHAYVSYHVKCSEGFMHTRMRRRVESLIQALDRAKTVAEKTKKTVQGKSFKRLQRPKQSKGLFKERRQVFTRTVYSAKALREHLIQYMVFYLEKNDTSLGYTSNSSSYQWTAQDNERTIDQPVPVTPVSSLFSSSVAPKGQVAGNVTSGGALSCSFSIWMPPSSLVEYRSIAVRFSPPSTDSYVVLVGDPGGCAPCAPDMATLLLL
ncbi:hypothetical protein Taro_016267 [Colocasia esculenta]|uniref:Arp2/3 complex 34 kDa subunit n=1 Tax=Colocasia esculenta TaxID=4460 RepID=A0A843UN34_COLES|nr:hypothetical protein [Colocasia esculenta]